MQTIPSNERRRAPRRQPTQGTTCNLLGSDGNSLGTALVWNMSTSGVSMLVAAQMEAGKEVRGELCPARGDGKVAINLRVTHVSKIRTGDFFLGAQFNRPLSNEELTPFLGD